MPFAVAVLLILGGCSFDYPLKAFFRGDQLYFDGAEKRWFQGRTGFCPDYLSVRLQSGATVWRIETDLPASDCRLFPVRYGSTPEGWTTVVPAQALRSGELYVVNADGGDDYHGAFHYREQRLLSVHNQPELARKLPRPPDKWDNMVEVHVTR